MFYLPEPTLSFKLRSRHDGKNLSCRVYLPKRLGQDGSLVKKGAIMAHPYAPLGGSFDDPVVGMVGNEILKHSWILLTFNFRGAGESEGRTSWTATPEVVDMESIVGFFIQYLDRLNFSPNKEAPASNEIQLICGGYSYGSMITTRLPALPAILAPFNHADVGTVTADIIETAEQIASETNEELHEAREARAHTAGISRISIDHTLAVGNGNQLSLDRKSREHRRSADIRRSLDLVATKIHLKRHKNDKNKSNQSKSEGRQLAARTFNFPIKMAYLLVSPILPPVSTLTAIPFRSYGEEGQTAKLKTSPVLAVYGGEDGFTSPRKVHAWGTELGETNPRFSMVEIEDAGHFWREQGTAKRLVQEVGKWIKNIPGDS